MSGEASRVMLAKKWDEGTDPTGWWMSEKLDGVRAYWSGSAFYSRNGIKFMAPKFFMADLPKEPLDGELWCGRGLFSKTMSIVKKKTPNKEQQKDWEYITYLVFDAPSKSDPYEKRVKYIQKTIDESKPTTYAAPVGVQKCEGVSHLKKILKAILIKGGEGVMLRKPGSAYESGKRSSVLLKCKFFHDEECKVTGSLPGTGRCASMMGKLLCVLPNGVTFKVGSGFTDAQRKKPPKKGDVITFKYQELSSHGNPRFPVFVRARPDMTWDDVLKNAKTKTPFSQMKRAAPVLKKQHSILFSTVPSRDPKGKKVVTTDDEDDKDDDSDTGAGGGGGGGDGSDDDGDDDGGKKIPCRYGELCFRSSGDHLKKYSHPKKPASKEKKPDKKPEKKKEETTPSSDDDNDDNDDDASEREKIKCRFGSKCYRKCPLHLKSYSHPASKKKDQSDDEEKDGNVSSDSDNDGLLSSLSSRSEGKTKAKSKTGDWGIEEEDSTRESKKTKESKTDTVDEEEMVTISRKDWQMIQTTMKKLEEYKGLVAEMKKKKAGAHDEAAKLDEPVAKRPKVLKASAFKMTDGS